MTPKVAEPALSKDEIRDRVLRHLYAIHETARGPKAVLTGIRDLQKALKALGITAAEATSNLDYLVQKDWVKEVVTSRPYRTPGGTVVDSAAKYYKISAAGMDLLEGASAYQRPDRTGTVNITNIQGVALVGDGNVVNTHFTDLARELGQLETAVSASEDLTDEQKLNVLSDISTIQSQLQKPEPYKGIVEKAWSGIARVADVGTLGDVILRIAPLVAAFAKIAV